MTLPMPRLTCSIRDSRQTLCSRCTGNRQVSVKPRTQCQADMGSAVRSSMAFLAAYQRYQSGPDVQRCRYCWPGEREERSLLRLRCNECEGHSCAQGNRGMWECGNIGGQWAWWKDGCVHPLEGIVMASRAWRECESSMAEALSSKMLDRHVECWRFQMFAAIAIPRRAYERPDLATGRWRRIASDTASSRGQQAFSGRCLGMWLPIRAAPSSTVQAGGCSDTSRTLRSRSLARATAFDFGLCSPHLPFVVAEQRVAERTSSTLPSAGGTTTSSPFHHHSSSDVDDTYLTPHRLLLLHWQQ